MADREVNPYLPLYHQAPGLIIRTEILPRQGYAAYLLCFQT